MKDIMNRKKLKRDKACVWDYFQARQIQDLPLLALKHNTQYFLII